MLLLIVYVHVVFFLSSKASSRDFIDLFSEKYLKQIMKLFNHHYLHKEMNSQIEYYTLLF